MIHESLASVLMRARLSRDVSADAGGSQRNDCAAGLPTLRRGGSIDGHKTHKSVGGRQRTPSPRINARNSWTAFVPFLITSRPHSRTLTSHSLKSGVPCRDFGSKFYWYLSLPP